MKNVSGIHLPVGKWSWWYFSEELKFARDNGYKISVIRGYSFNRSKSIFDKYISDIYKIKSAAINPVQKSMAKSLLNKLLGRVGIKLDKAVSDIVSTDTFNKLATMKKINSYKELDNDKVLVTFIDKLDNDIINSHNLDIVKLSNIHRDRESTSIDNTSVVISAAVTAYARIHMSKLKLDIISKKGNIYYTDTDSIVCDIQLNNDLVDPNLIGKLKLEHTINKGIFISGKTYCLIDNNDKTIKRAKGVKSNSLVYSDYEKLLKNEDVNTAIRITSHIDWSLGHVVIGEKLVTLKADSYKKRDKVYHNDKWIDTKPMVLQSNLNFVEWNKYFKPIVKSVRFLWWVITCLLLVIIILLCFIAWLLTYDDYIHISSEDTNLHNKSVYNVDPKSDNKHVDKYKFMDGLSADGKGKISVSKTFDSYDDEYINKAAKNPSNLLDDELAKMMEQSPSPDSLTEDMKPKKSLYEGFLESTPKENSNKPEKTLYEGFMERNNAGSDECSSTTAVE